MYPNIFKFDRVYGCDSSTKQVYDEGVKGIALSVLYGINSSIFAYGQTSSGKTYTMSGITEYAIADIYDYISKQDNREFSLKFSALEIYNECVKDLLSSDGANLRLLDDPEKGTVVEKLTEANLRDCSHLMELIYACEAERQIGETALNEMSSRSHQILRLTVESSACEYRGADSGRTLAATVNFVDLAGSERASQTLAAGTRLKEGCHINRSLLTLGTVIRKLSKSGNGHVPYRNSKLTRILQNSLGGNARTAILCTMSPAHSHVEQSRNTLLFGSCAKDVSTNAQVNVVMSDKALVKQLQQELARLESEMKSFYASNDSMSIIRDMELQIEKMEIEIEDLTQQREDLTQQRDLAQSRLEQLIQVTGVDRRSLPWETGHLYESEQISQDITMNTEDESKEQNRSIEEISVSVNDNNVVIKPEDGRKEEDVCIDETLNLEKNNNIITEDFLATVDHGERSPCSSDTNISDSESMCVTRSKSCNEFTTITSSPPSESQMVTETMDNHEFDRDLKQQILPKSKSEADVMMNSQEDSHTHVTSLDDNAIEHTIKSSEATDYNKLVKETEPTSNNDWFIVFEKQRREIIELWHKCDTPLIHRTYFFLLFKGDQSDSVYMEVELRRLSFLKSAPSCDTSARALSRERIMLSKKLRKKFSPTQRDELFKKWGIPLDSKNRRVQLSHLVWTKTNDIDHIKDSAQIVAKLVGIVELNRTPNELFGLSFLPKSNNFKTSFWKATMSFT
ncbi:kinesin-like protein KIN-7C [Rutidosis leptorrhynchoides]|uniref:kinesin-like protein KIN-7C n=1 Tax=Rutidosis leptorrhynchoides TaxID=125765 RepID=UPI003A9942F1